MGYRLIGDVNLTLHCKLGILLSSCGSEAGTLGCEPPRPVPAGACSRQARQRGRPIDRNDGRGRRGLRCMLAIRNHTHKRRNGGRT